MNHPKVILDNYDALSDDPEVQESLDRVMEWEEALIEFLKEWQAVSKGSKPNFKSKVY